MRVLISGAGIAGSTLALLMSKLGHEVLVVEKRDALHPHGQNVDIKGSAITAMKRLGLMERVKELHTTEAGTRFVDSSGRPYASFPQDGSAGSLTAEHEILRGDLAVLLYEAAVTKANVAYLFDTVVRNVLANDEKGVQVELSNGEVQSFDLVVAADGLWSKLRSIVFPAEDVSMVDLNSYAAYWTLPRQAEDDNWWNIYFAQRSRNITIRPDPHGTVRTMLTCMPATESQKAEWQSVTRSSPQEQQAMLRREFADVGWQGQRFLDSMNEAPDFYFQPFQQVKMKRWARGRIICLGDTAYSPTPLTGMGTSLAITGAYVLAGEISKASLSPAEVASLPKISQAFSAYEARFRPFVEKAQRVVPMIPTLMHPANLWRLRLVQGLVVSLSWIVPYLGTGSGSAESDDDGFPLPEYPGLDSDSTG